MKYTLGTFGLVLSAIVVAFLTILTLAESAQAQTLYAYKGKRGTITYTSRKPAGKAHWTVKAPKPSRSYFVVRGSSRGRGGVPFRPTRSKFDQLIKELAVAHQVEPALVKAVVHAESAFNPRARSHKGAMGLMQLMPATAQRFGISNAYSPIDNLVGGVRYLRWLSVRFKGNTPHILAGYNAGEGAVDRHGGIPPYRETREYVRRVMKLREFYRCDYDGTKEC